MKWKWLLLAAPFGVAIFLVVGIWQVVRSDEFQRDWARLREQRRSGIDDGSGG